jgi:hypothetical protein
MSTQRATLVFVLAVILLLVLTGGMHTTPANGKPLVITQVNVTAPPGRASNPYQVTGKPSISAHFIDTILCTWHSPTCGKGQKLYDLGVQYGIDPVFALAFFLNESSFGTAGMARATLALGNERCIDDRPCVNALGGECQAGQSCYAQFYSWEDGFEHWYMLIRDLYIRQWHLTTVEAIVPTYAPAADHNVPAHYIAVVEHAVDLWRAGKIALA